MAITVRIARTGAEIKEVALSNRAKAKDALTTAGITLASGEVLTKDGAVVDLESTLTNGDILFVEQNDENGN